MSDAAKIFNNGLGSAYSYHNLTVTSFLSTLIGAFSLLISLIIVFTLVQLRGGLPAIYYPRASKFTIVKFRVPLPPRSAWRWIPNVLTAGDDRFLAAGLDCYFFNRFMRLIIFIFLPMTIILPILLPIHRIGTSRGNVAMDLFGFANLTPEQKERCGWAHVCIMIAVMSCFCSLVSHEMKEFVKIRQKELNSPFHRIRARSSTVLIEQIPSQYLDDKSIRKLYSFLPSGVKNIWLNRNYSDLERKIKHREKMHQNLERLETDLIIKALHRHIKRQKNSDSEIGLRDSSSSTEDESNDQLRANSRAKRRGRSSGDPQEIERLNAAITQLDGSSQSPNMNDERCDNTSNNTILREILVPKLKFYKATRFKEHLGSSKVTPTKMRTTQPRISNDYPPAFSQEVLDSGEDNAIWQQYIAPKERPTMRLPLKLANWMPQIPFLGKRVDAIYHCRTQLADLNLQIEMDQRECNTYPPMNSAFIQFNRQIDAHIACQSVHHHKPRHMAYRLVEVDPRGVVWKNLGFSWGKIKFRKFMVLAIVLGLNIAWLFPVAFAGALSRLDQISPKARFLATFESWPPRVQATVQGVLPPLLMTLYMALLPPLLKALVKFSGAPTTSEISLQLQQHLFGFMLVQHILATTASASATVLISKIAANPLNITEWLARDVPTAANFFYAFLLVQAFCSSAVNLAQPWKAIVWMCKRARTPRERYKKERGDQFVDVAAQIPIITIMGTIGLLFCLISPLIIPFVLLSVSLYWFAWRYRLLYVVRPKVDTTGLIYPSALNQLFAGIYLMELSFIGLLALAIKDRGRVAVKAQMAMAIIVLFSTAVFQIALNRSFSSLLRFLPMSLEGDSAACEKAFELSERIKWAKKQEEQNQKQESAPVSREAPAPVSRAVSRLRHSESRTHSPGPSTSDGIQAPKSSVDADSAHVADSEPLSSSKVAAALERSIDQEERSREDTLVEQSLPLRSLSPTIRPGSPLQNELSNDEEIAGPSNSVGGEDHQLKDGPAGATTLDAQEPLGRSATSSPPSSENLLESTDLKDLSPAQREQLTNLAFQHPATRAIRPCVWIPRDEFGISDDVVSHMERFSSPDEVDDHNKKWKGKERVAHSEESNPSVGMEEEDIEMSELPGPSSAAPRQPLIDDDRKPKAWIWTSNDHASYDHQKKKIIIGGKPPDMSVFWADKHGEMEL